MPAKRCPLCHRTTAAAAWQCACGFAFGQSLERVRVLLRDQLTNLRITLAFLLALDAAAVSGAVWAAMHGFIVFSSLGLTALILATVRAAQKLWVTRASLQQLSARDTLPRAVVYRR